MPHITKPTLLYATTLLTWR